MRTLAVINHKGGVGKTTTAVNLAAAMGERGLRVLLIDLDPQGSASDWLRVHDDSRGMFDVFIGSRDLASLARPTIVPGVEIVPASPWLVTVERTLLADAAAGFVRAIRRLAAGWDLVVIDCPPSIAYLSVAALAACREVLIPIETRSIALPGAANLITEMDRVRVELNPELRQPWILACRVNRTVHSREVLATLRAEYGGAVFGATVRDSIRLAEAVSLGLPVTLSAPDSPAAHDFRAVAVELLRGVGSGSGQGDQGPTGWLRRLAGSTVAR